MATETRWVSQGVHVDTRADEPVGSRLRTVATLATLEDGEFVPSADLLDGVECGYFSPESPADAEMWLTDRGVGRQDAMRMVEIALDGRGRTARLIDGKIQR